MRASQTFTPGKLAIPALMLALISATPSLAGPPQARSSFQDTARVVSNTPVYESVNEPRRECWEEQVGYERVEERRSSDHNVGGAIVGGILGGVVGNSIGKGDGRKAATAIGAAVGAITGDKYGSNRREYRDEPRPDARPIYEQRCREVDNWTRKLTGYNVIYRYHGREYNAFLPYDPGYSVRVNVSVSLADQ